MPTLPIPSWPHNTGLEQSRPSLQREKRWKLLLFLFRERIIIISTALIYRGPLGLALCSALFTDEPLESSLYAGESGEALC